MLEREVDALLAHLPEGLSIRIFALLGDMRADLRELARGIAGFNEVLAEPALQEGNSPVEGHMIDIVPRPARFSSRLRYDRQQCRAEDAGQDHIAGTISNIIRDGPGSLSAAPLSASIASFKMTNGSSRKKALTRLRQLP